MIYSMSDTVRLILFRTAELMMQKLIFASNLFHHLQLCHWSGMNECDTADSCFILETSTREIETDIFL